MHLVRQAIERPGATTRVSVPVDRLQLAKTRWRGVAADGVEFGFDLAHPLQHGDCILAGHGVAYCIEQMTEAVLEIALPGAPAAAAKTGWLMGNLHQPVQIEPGLIRMADDPSVRQLLEQLRIPFRETRAVFVPFRSAAHHHHGH